MEEDDRSTYLDSLVDNRICMGKYHYLMIFAIGSLFIADTCNTQTTGFLTLNSEVDFRANKLQQTLMAMASLCLAGFFVGSLLLGPF